MKQKQAWLTPTNLLLTIMGIVISAQLNFKIQDDKELKREVREEIKPEITQLQRENQIQDEKIHNVDLARVDGDEGLVELMCEKGKLYQMQFDVLRESVNKLNR